MAEISFPFNPTPVFQNQWSQMVRTVISDGPTGAADLLTFGDGSGMQVKVPAGNAWVQGFFYENTAQMTLAVAAADPTHPRLDLVVLHCDEVGGSIHAQVKTGTPAASPVAPALTQTDGTTWEIAIAEVLVFAAVSTITASNVLDIRTFAHGAGAPTRAYGTCTGATDVNSASDQAVGSGLSATIMVPGRSAIVRVKVQLNVAHSSSSGGLLQFFLKGTGTTVGTTAAGTLGVGLFEPVDGSGNKIAVQGDNISGSPTVEATPLWEWDLTNLPEGSQTFELRVYGPGSSSIGFAGPGRMMVEVV